MLCAFNSRYWKSVVTAPPPPDIVIVFVAPVPLATTPAPTKLSVVAAVDKDDPSSCTVTSPPLAAIVTESALASVVTVTFVPPTIVSVSVAVSAATVSCQLTAILENAFWFASPLPPPLPPSSATFHLLSAATYFSILSLATPVVSTSDRSLIPETKVGLFNI